MTMTLTLMLMLMLMLRLMEIIITMEDVSMSNVYLANSLIHLACKQGGGFEGENERCTNYNVTVYGMKPGALISNIAVIASVLSALLMPFFGAIIDFTPHRRMVGVGTAIGLGAISAIQIGTNEVRFFLFFRVFL
jgi:MFS-type transporter involved in bile tolerance (Atg22 family)